MKRASYFAGLRCVYFFVSRGGSHLIQSYRYRYFTCRRILSAFCVARFFYFRFPTKSKTKKRVSTKHESSAVEAAEEVRDGGGEMEDQQARRHPEGFDDGDAFMEKMRQKMMEKRNKLEKDKKNASSASSSANAKALKGGPGDAEPSEELAFERDDEEEQDKDNPKDEVGGGGSKTEGWAAEDETGKEKARRKAIKARAKEYEALREELKMKHRAARVMTGEERATYDAVRVRLVVKKGRRQRFFKTCDPAAKWWYERTLASCYERLLISSTAYFQWPSPPSLPPPLNVPKRVCVCVFMERLRDPH